MMKNNKSIRRDRMIRRLVRQYGRRVAAISCAAVFATLGVGLMAKPKVEKNLDPEQVMASYVYECEPDSDDPGPCGASYKQTVLSAAASYEPVFEEIYEEFPQIEEIQFEEINQDFIKHEVKTVEAEAPREDEAPKQLSKKNAEPKYKVSDSEFLFLCKLVKAERTPQDHKTRMKEMTAIAATVLNRVYGDNEYPDSIYEVLNQDSQFTPVKNGTVYWYSDDGYRQVYESDLDDEIREAVQRAVDGEDPTKAILEGGSLFYYSDSYISGLSSSNYERRVREAIPSDEEIQFGDTVFHRIYPDV